jgi:uncharacterized membrane protein
LRTATHTIDEPAAERGAAHQELDMFKVIGVVVVYGFALLGLAKYLESTHPNM